MTLLFFLRSPAGNTDTGQSPSAPVYWEQEPLPERKPKRDRKAERLARKMLEEANAQGRKRKKKRKDEELLMMLFMHEFDGYDD
jgi:hypothetical protein